MRFCLSLFLFLFLSLLPLLSHHPLQKMCLAKMNSETIKLCYVTILSGRVLCTYTWVVSQVLLCTVICPTLRPQASSGRRLSIAALEHAGCHCRSFAPCSDGYVRSLTSNSSALRDAPTTTRCPCYASRQTHMFKLIRTCSWCPSTQVTSLIHPRKSCTARTDTASILNLQCEHARNEDHFGCEGSNHTPARIAVPLLEQETPSRHWC